MGVFQTREELIASRFPNLLRAWFDSLPPEGWTGSASELAAELDSLNSRGRFYAMVPWRRIGPELATRAALLEELGWTMSTTRTATERRIVFTRKRASK